jgi:hypothetical protein
MKVKEHRLLLLAISFGCQTLFSKYPFSLIFNLGNKAKSQELNLASREDGE